MKNILLLIITIACFASNSILSAQQIIVVQKTSQAIKIDGNDNEAIWQQAKELDVEKNGIKLSIKSCYNNKNIFLYFDLQSAKHLTKPEVKLFIEPVIPHNQVRVLATKALDYFTLTFTPQGIQTKLSDYNGKVMSRSIKKANGGFVTELSLPMPENMKWVRIGPKAGEYYNIAAQVKVNHLRHPLFFFNNHDNKIKGCMSKLLFCSQKSPPNKALFFDMHNVYQKYLIELKGHIEELKRLNMYKAGNNFALLLNKWKKQNSEFSERDYKAHRFFQLQALKRITNKAYKVRTQCLKQAAIKKSQDVLLTPYPCFADKRLAIPTTLPTAEDIKQNELNLEICPDETSALSALLWSDKTLYDVTFNVAPFVNQNNEKVSVFIDKYYVKCWYQGSDLEETHTHKVLTPELLLKNPDLVQVDYLNKNNILKIYHNSTAKRLYPDDSKTLLPVKILPAGFAQQLWINLKFPRNTKAGIYKSKITVKTSSGKIAQLPVKVKVLNFNLDRSPLTNNIYTYSNWGKRDDKVVLAEIKSLRDHGIDYVGISEKTKDLKRVVKLMQQGWMPTDRIYLQGEGNHVFWSGMSMDSAKQIVKRVLKELKGTNVKEVYFYLPDEAAGKRLLKSIEIAKAIHEAGGKTWGAANRYWYKTAGEIFDHVNISGYPVGKEYVKKVHQDGNKIFCYGNPQGGIERPEKFRRNYGLKLWCAGYDGGMTWSWWWPFGLEGDAWNDFDHNFWRDHCMVYPTRNGVVSTIQFEGYLKGVNDTRYLGTLLNLLKRAPGNNPEVKKIKAYLNGLQNKDINLNDLDRVRNELIKGIETCRKILK